MDLPADWSTDTVHANGVELQYYRTDNGPQLVMERVLRERALLGTVGVGTRG